MSIDKDYHPLILGLTILVFSIFSKKGENFTSGFGLEKPPSSHPIFLNMYKEDLATDLHGSAIKDILTFLEADQNVTLSTDFQKVSPKLLHDSVSNYDELVNALKNNKLEEFLY